MNKTELIDAIAKDSGLSKADSSRALESILTTVTKTLKKGDEVAITGFGRLTIVCINSLHGQARGAHGPQPPDRGAREDQGLQERQVHRRSHAQERGRESATRRQVASPRRRRQPPGMRNRFRRPGRLGPAADHSGVYSSANSSSAARPGSSSAA